jgi:glycosyltransferase involved in cell wall biosynthesis
VPFSEWAAAIIRQCGAPRENVQAIHVGIDLDQWDYSSASRHSDHCLPRILFVGGDFERKGGSLLLDVFQREFQDRAELFLVTKQAPPHVPPGVRTFTDFSPNDARLTQLYSTVDMLVVPTSADTGPLWAYMEAMAMGLPIIGTDTGANTELVRHGQTGLVVGIGNGGELASAIRLLLDDATLRRRLGEEGRALVERNYNARLNVPRILEAMKRAVDASRSAGLGSGAVSTNGT